MDEIFIEDLLIRGVIGISEHEREQPQDILVNVSVFTDTFKAGNSDNVNESVNYRTIAKKILAHTEKINRYTVEALAEDIARICLAEPGAIKVKVKVEKPGAVRFSKSVGVVIVRPKE
ncbi:MAG TPA: dihydroneopterin aldolase [Anaerolineaceae bacterium]|nr:dihydroneopterin aldolase [Anaerolineaceae bacterium]HOV06744.1 dihydroneopterin aldolase [Anaerolineaceae bacterium]